MTRGIKTEILQLVSNIYSDKELCKWVNRTFY